MLKISKSIWRTDMKWHFRDKHYDEWEEGQDSERIAILDIIDSLEVKEMDFEKIWKEYFKYRGDVATVNVKHLAKHFFELGLKAQKDNELTWKDIEKICLIAKEVHQFRGFWIESVYQEVLKRFKEWRIRKKAYDCAPQL